MAPASPSHIVQQFTDYLLADGRVNSPLTVAYRRRWALRWLAFCARRGKPWLEAQRADAVAWSLELRQADVWHGDSIRQAIITGRDLYDWAQEMEWYLHPNPFRKLKAPPVRPAIKLPLEEADVRAMLDRTWPSDFLWLRRRAIVLVLYGCGLRANECRMLEVADVDLHQRLVAVNHGKGHTQYVQVIPEETAIGLDEYLRAGRPLKAASPTGPLFVGERLGRRITYDALASDVKAVFQRLGRRVTPHDMRRSGASHLLQHGATIAEVQAWLNHRSLASTQRYVRASGLHVARAVLQYHPLSQARRSA